MTRTWKHHGAATKSHRRRRPPRRPPSCIATPSNVSPPPKDPPSTLGSAVPVSIPHSRSLVSHSARASLGSLAGSEHFVAAQSA